MFSTAVTSLMVALLLGVLPLLPVVAEEPRSLTPIVTGLMEADASLEDVAFADVVEAATGRVVLAFDPELQTHRDLRRHLRESIESVLVELRRPDHAAHEAGRINEVSRFFEEALLETLDASPRYQCTIPQTAAGDLQRSGYPDLRIVDSESGLVAYLDPKLYAADSRSSSFRTFYYEPKKETNKILDDALHLILGIAHDGRDEAGAWQFTDWSLVDLAGFRVRLKAEFQSSNRELYRDELFIDTASSPKPTP